MEAVTGADLSFVNLGITIEHLPNSITVFGFRIAFYGIIIGLGCWPAWPLRAQTPGEEGRTRIFIWILRFTPLYFPLWGQGLLCYFRLGKL